MVRLLIAIVMGAVAGASAEEPTTIYVDAAAMELPHNGSDWCHAFLTLDEALTATHAGNTIRVAGGLYKPNTSGLADPREASFALKDGVTIEGGYAGCGAPDPNARDYFIYETVLSGDIGVQNVQSDNCYHVIVGGAVAPSTVLDGLTIQSGNANVGVSHRLGGGMLLAGGSATVRNCVFRFNAAEFGGGLYVQEGSPSLDNVTFALNQAIYSGGGMYCYSSLAEPGPAATDCFFVANTAASSGGGVRSYDSNATFTRSRFERNQAHYGGAAVAIGGQSVLDFDRCIFDTNKADSLLAQGDALGGAIHETDEANSTFVSCAFVGNEAFAIVPGLGRGGAIAENGNAQSTFINCTLAQNTANIGSGIYADGLTSTDISNSILQNNVSEIVLSGGATAAVTYTAITGGWSGTGNTADDPLLDNLRLQPGSPCINTGDPASSPTEETDLDGHARMLCGRVDMGAYEFGRGDFNCDQSVDLADYAQWDACMTGPAAGPYSAGCEAFDSEFDDDVDLLDFASFQLLFDSF